MGACWASVGSVLQRELADFSDVDHLVSVGLRLFMAALLGGVLGLERQRGHKPAGLRTHMLVALGAALFVIVAHPPGSPYSDVGRVLQGVAAGIGFLGGGVILKVSEQHEVKGLTTATSIWMTTAVGAAAGLGRFAVALIGVVLGLLILSALHRLEKKSKDHAHEFNTPKESSEKE